MFVAIGPHPFGHGSKPMGSHCGLGEFTTHLGEFQRLDWEVRWGSPGLFDPWPVGVGSTPGAGEALRFPGPRTARGRGAESHGTQC